MAGCDLDTDQDRALLNLLQALAAEGYRFVTPTPATHARVVARPDKRRARDLRDVFGWSLPFDEGLLPPVIRDLLARAGMIESRTEGLASAVRVASRGDFLFLHSAYPTDSEDAVFFGPDSYRFADFIEAELAGAPPIRRLVDFGAGTGVGGLVAARAQPGAETVLTDINPKALRLARINAAYAGQAATLISGEGLAEVDGPVDLIVANPPYILDAADRDYRDGGGMHGAEVSLDMAAEALARLAPGGRLLLYTGAAIIDGENPLCAALERLAARFGASLLCRELDPDVFGEELSNPPYADVERIAVVGATLTVP